uniref:Uncharacterized protein n=1 Tax=Oryza rufipogon TaxID=4529 RepID=A0A0E0QYU3_ORYRU
MSESHRTYPRIQGRPIAVSPFAVHRISLLGKVNRISAQLITRGDVVLRLQGTNCVDQKPDRVCVMFPLNQ